MATPKTEELCPRCHQRWGLHRITKAFPSTSGAVSVECPNAS